MLRRRIRSLEEDEQRAAQGKPPPKIEGPTEVVIGGRRNSWLAAGLVAGEGSPMRNKTEDILRAAVRVKLGTHQLLVPKTELEKPVAYICNVPIYTADLVKAEDTDLVEIIVAKLLVLHSTAEVTKAVIAQLGYPIKTQPELVKSQYVTYVDKPPEAVGPIGHLPILPGTQVQTTNSDDYYGDSYSG